MAALRELELRFAQALFAQDATGFGSQIRANGLSGERRLNVYRHNTFASLTEALAAVYPVIQRLVGEGFFRYAAHAYLRRHPSRSGNLHDFGGEFAAFLAGLPEAAGLVYLPDIARLEWAWHEAFHEAEHAPLDLTALAEVPPERYGELKFRLHPASRLLASAYPVLRIWEVNQEGYAGEETVDLSQGGVQLLVIRRGLEVFLEARSPGEFELLQALAAGLPFAQACEAALAAQSDLDLPACLQGHVLRGTLVDFTNPPNPPLKKGGEGETSFP